MTNDRLLRRVTVGSGWVVTQAIKKTSDCVVQSDVCCSGAGPTGLEPATSALTGRRSNQAELRSHCTVMCGPKRDRTADLFNAIEALSQLSYGPVSRRKRSANIGVYGAIANEIIE
jgi:hypothetical protein